MFRGRLLGPACRSSIPSGGARRDRTDDLMLAKHALSQLSYGPDRVAQLADRGRLGKPGIDPAGHPPGVGGPGKT